MLRQENETRNKLLLKNKIHDTLKHGDLRITARPNNNNLTDTTKRETKFGSVINTAHRFVA
jgi:hypothetical protein